MKPFSLVGVSGNAYAILGYTVHALEEAGLANEVDEMLQKAIRGNYHNLIMVCNEYVSKANKVLGLTCNGEEEE